MTSAHPRWWLGSFAVLVACGGGGGSAGGGGSGGSPPDDATSSDASSTTASTGSGEVDPCEGLGPVSFAADVAPVLAQRCATTGCHAGAIPDGSMDLSEASAHAETVGEATKACSGGRVRVVPGDPRQSYVWDKIEGTDLCGTSNKMPPSGKPQLTDDEKLAITAWICAGALDD